MVSAREGPFVFFVAEKQKTTLIRKPSIFSHVC